MKIGSTISVGGSTKNAKHFENVALAYPIRTNQAINPARFQYFF
jgi:hypothetical protein